MTQAISSPAQPSGAGGQLTTHVLDTVQGRPASGMRIELFRQESPLTADGLAAWCLLRTAVTNDDGRVDGPLLAGPNLLPGRYRLVFQVEDYFRGQGAALPTPAFLEAVPLEFGVADAHGHYHVPLLVSPWSYSTYRGS